MWNHKISAATRAALTTGAAAAIGPFQVSMGQQASGSAPARAVSELQEITVTGTLIHREGADLAIPLTVFTQEDIQQSGAVILGDLLERLPEVAGFYANPQLANFRAGTGATNITLRALGGNRTLILLDGRRLNNNDVDVNAIPVNMIERVEVLKEGAGAIYGSDAVGGVVNFITKKPTDGVEVRGDWGKTTHGDGQHHDVGVTFGTTNDRMSIMVGGDYNQQDGITAGRREYSKYALYLYSGKFTRGGISATPTGRIFLPPSLQALYGCQSVTRAAGSSGATLADYGCFGSGGPYAGIYNYQPPNLLLSPQERGAIFFKASFKANDYIEAYTQVLYNHTNSASQNSPVSLQLNAEQVVESKNSIYNPFGVDFGGGAAVGGVNPDAQIQLPFGPLAGDQQTDQTNVYAGLRGKILETTWSWDATVSYSRIDQKYDVQGFALTSVLNNALGPSFISSNGTPMCGTPAQPIANCIPANFFNLASTPAALPSLRGSYSDETYSRYNGFNLDLQGDVVALPAGKLQASVGADYLGFQGSYDTSVVTRSTPPNFDSCDLASYTCSSPYSGSYNVKEGYGEIFIPLLKDLPAVASLNADLGVRYSSYSLFGSTTRSQFKVEYSPVQKVLLRGTYSQVFRAPSISEAFQGASGGQVGFNDPCTGYTGSATAVYPNLPSACVGVPTNGSYHPLTAQALSVSEGNPNLKPEEGYVATGGLAVRGLGGFSGSVDYWVTKLNGIISGISPTFAIQQCALTGAPSFCDLYQRYTSGPNAGRIIVFNSPTFNLGGVDITGVDIDLKYELPDTKLGSWRFTVDVTQLSTFKSTALPGAATNSIAGTFDGTWGNLAKTRGLAGVAWSGWGADALLQARYIGSVNLPFADGTVAPDGTFYYQGLHIPSYIYYNLTVGYTSKATGTRLQLSIINLADKKPPIFGEGWATAGGATDSATYDEIGRRFTLGFVQKF
jgi:iron complex outermembrane receptor protein